MAGATHRRGSSSSKHGKHRRIAYKNDHSVKPAPTNSEINVTPLVDVCLVLLIIFMVVTPMLGRGVDVELPLLVSASQHKEGDQVFISVNDDGAWVETDVYTEKDLFMGRLEEDLKIAAGKALANDAKGPLLFLKGDKGTDWGRVKTVMEWITSSNVQMQDIALVVDLPENT